MMKFYNIKAGAHLKRAGAGILRRHSAPDRARFEKYVSLDPELGRLAQSGAEYCLATDEEVCHFGLKAAKTFEKNLHYLRALLEGPKEVEGLILDSSETKICLWIPSWQHIASIRTVSGLTLAEGQKVHVQFAINLLGRHWKERIITKIIQ